MDTQLIDAADQYGATRRIGNKVFRKVYFASGYTQYAIYQIAAGATGPTATAVATRSVVGMVCVPQGATTTTAGWYWAQIQGPATMLVEGTTDVASGNMLEVLNAETSAKLDHASVESANTIAVAAAAQAANSAVAIPVWLLGKEKAQAAS